MSANALAVTWASPDAEKIHLCVRFLCSLSLPLKLWPRKPKLTLLEKSVIATLWFLSMKSFVKQEESQEKNAKKSKAEE